MDREIDPKDFKDFKTSMKTLGKAVVAFGLMFLFLWLMTK